MGEYQDEKILIVTPDFSLKQSFAVILERINVAALFIDKVHLLTQWQAFKDCFLLLKRVVSKCKSSTHILSATLNDADLEKIEDRLAVKFDTVIRTSSMHPNLKIDVASGYTLQTVVDTCILLADKYRGRGIIYCQEKSDCDS